MKRLVKVAAGVILTLVFTIIALLAWQAWAARPPRFTGFEIECALGGLLFGACFGLLGARQRMNQTEGNMARIAGLLIRFMFCTLAADLGGLIGGIFARARFYSVQSTGDVTAFLYVIIPWVLFGTLGVLCCRALFREDTGVAFLVFGLMTAVLAYWDLLFLAVAFFPVPT